MKLIRKTALCALAACLIAGAACGAGKTQSTPQWQPLAAQDGSFTALFPAAVSTAALPNNETYYTTQANGASYRIISQKRPAFISQVGDTEPKLLAEFVQGFTHSFQERAAQEKAECRIHPGANITIPGAVGQDCAAQVGDRMSVIRVWLTPKSLYILTVNYGREVTPDVARFFDSFRIQ